MQITDPSNNPTLFIEKVKAEVLQKLRPGQMLNARVASPLQQGVLQLNIGGQRLPVKTTIDLPVGTPINISVVKSGQQPELLLIRPQTIENATQLALKTILPRQQPVHQLLDSLATLTKPPLQTSGQVTPGTTDPGTPNRMPPQSQVIQPGEPQKTFERLIRQFQQITAGSTPKTTSTTLPQQTETQRLLQQLQTLSRALPATPQSHTQASTPAQNPDQLVSRIIPLVRHAISENRPLTGESVKQLFQQSGLFLEAGLAGKQPLQPDLKMRLSQLLADLQPLTQIQSQAPAPTTDAALDTGKTLQLLAAKIFIELKNMADSSLARVQMHQLASLPQDDNSGRQIWQFELPVQHPEGHDEFLLRFEREKNPQDDSDIRWSVTLHFDIPPAGPITARLSLANDELSSHFTALKAESVEQIEAQLPKLDEALQRAGLKVGKLSTRQGEPETTPGRPSGKTRLLDEKA